MKKIIIFCLLFFCKYSFGDSNFVIQKIHTDNIYYNVVIYENEVYVSSNHGIFLIDSSSGKLVMHDKSVEGIINSDLSKNLGFKKCELMATQSGKLLYEAKGYKSIEDVLYKTNSGKTVPMIRMEKFIS